MKIHSTLSITILLFAFEAHAADKAAWSNLRDVKAGRNVTVSYWNGHREKGAFRSFSDRSITIHTSKGDVAIPRPDVRKVSADAGLKRMRNALIGMGAGAAIGATIATKTSATGHRSSALATALFSFAVGTIAGAAMPVRNTIYEAKKPDTRPLLDDLLGHKCAENRAASSNRRYAELINEGGVAVPCMSLRHRTNAALHEHGRQRETK